MHHLVKSYCGFVGQGKYFVKTYLSVLASQPTVRSGEVSKGRVSNQRGWQVKFWYWCFYPHMLIDLVVSRKRLTKKIRQSLVHGVCKTILFKYCLNLKWGMLVVFFIFFCKLFWLISCSKLALYYLISPYYLTCTV